MTTDTCKHCHARITYEMKDGAYQWVHDHSDRPMCMPMFAEPEGRK